MDQRFAVLLTSILSALTATAAMYTELAVASANYYRRKREMFMSIITDSSNKISAISQLLKAKKRGVRNRRFWQRPGRTSAWRAHFVRDVVLREEWRKKFPFWSFADSLGHI